MKKNTLGTLGLALAAIALVSQRHKFLPKPYPLQPGPLGTALITGASAGMGTEFARQLAGRGYDLILLARREDRLRLLADELHARYGAQVQVWVADLSDRQAVETVAARIGAEPNLALLVNNAGFGVEGDFIHVDPQKQQNMIQVNVNSLVRLARAAVPAMVERRRGAIINVSSMASFIPYGGSHTYGSSKSYVTYFSKSLHIELRGTGVHVQALCPGFTHTEFHAEMSEARIGQIPAFMWLNAEDVVRESINALETGEAVVVPGTFYKVGAFFAPLIAPFMDLLPF